MSGVPFEDPAKTDLRVRIMAAMERAGYEVRDPPHPVAIPPATGLSGAIKGDVQGVSTDDRIASLYAIPTPGAAVPKWVANFGSAAHQMDGVEVYAVVRQSGPDFEASCRAAGLGLLVLNEDDELEQVINFEDARPFGLDDALKESEQEVRRSLESRFDGAQADLMSRRTNVLELTRGMDANLAESYVRNIEDDLRSWSDWSADLSKRLDAAFAQRDKEEIDEIGQLVTAGPSLSDD